MPITLIPIATHDPRSKRATIFIRPSDLLRSVYVVGKTGTGKSALLERLLLGAVGAGFGACLVDPHGDLSRRVLALLPRSEANNVIYFAPAETERPVGLSLLAPWPGASRSLVASSLVEVFRKLWGATLFGPRSEHLLRNAILVLLENPGTTLPSLLRLLVDEPYRLRLMERVTDPIVRVFWLKEFPSLSKNFAAEVTAPVLNKLGALTAPSVRRVVGQTAPRLHLSDVLEKRRILIVDLSRIGRDAAGLLGALVVAGLSLAARARAARPISERRPFLLVADEFQTYLTESFAELLAEGRKFAVAAVLAHQHAAQLPAEVRAAVLGNAGTLIAFRLSASDAETLEPEFAPEIVARDLVRLRRHKIALRLLRAGEPLPPMICRTIPPEAVDLARGTTLQRISSERYGRSVATIDRELAETLGASATA